MEGTGINEIMSQTLTRFPSHETFAQINAAFPAMKLSIFICNKQDFRDYSAICLADGDAPIYKAIFTGAAK